MAAFVSTVPVPSIDATGIHIPAFADILSALKADYRSVYGQDVYLESDSQDGEWIGIQAAAYNDLGAVAFQAYNAFSPATAQGTGLSSVVKVNGIARAVSSSSTADLTIVGQAGTIINGGIASDGINKWLLPAVVVIPLSGQIVVTATCQTSGAVTAAPNTITGLATPTRGWQSVTNAAAATPGAPVEQDPQLRVRQSQSTMLPARGVIDGIQGAIAAIAGVTRLRLYENDGGTTDANGIPGHSISAVVDGGDALAIATAIALRKLGSGTYGDVVQTVVTGAAGIPRDIRFFRPVEPPVTYRIPVKAFAGYTTDVQAAIQQAVSDWTNSLGIGVGSIGKIRLSRAEAAAELIGTAAESTFEVLGITAARDGGALSSVDPAFAFNEAPFCTPVLVTVVPS